MEMALRQRKREMAVYQNNVYVYFRICKLLKNVGNPKK